MSVSLSRLERGQPPPRSKSCAACIRAKRRCDRSLPRCARCAHRQLACEYPSKAPPPAASRRSIVATLRRPSRAATTTKAGSATGPDSYAEDIVPATPLGFAQEPGVAAATGERDGALCGAAELQLGEVDAALGALPATEYLVAEDWMASGFSEFFNDDSLLRIGLGDSIDFALNLPSADHDPPASLVDVETQPSLPPVPSSSFDVEAITERMECNLSYAVGQIKNAPRTMLLEIQTPWSHASLYKKAMPRVMQDALSACALYESKNTVNSPAIIRCINTKVADLLRSAIPTERLEMLAHTQSLMLYQIMRFFDGDIIARSSADATFSQLDHSTRCLYNHINWNADAHSGASPGYCNSGNNNKNNNTHSAASHLDLQGAAPGFWHDWIFEESARRTYLVARFFIHVWELLTGQARVTGCRDISPALLKESWTLSAHLWQAPDPVGFAAAWAGKRHYVVRRKAILSTLVDVKSEDVEAFGKMILTTSMGITQAKVWLASIGAKL